MIAAAVPAVTGGVALVGAGMGGEGRLHPMFEVMDANKDGTVTRDEIAGHNAARAGEIDAEKGRKITASELEAWHDAEREKARNARMERALAQMDANGDGAVSVGELEVARPWLLTRLDPDGDDKIGLDEAPDLLGRLG
mgnify:CR=1 FL=1